MDDDDDAPPLVKKTRLKLYDKRGPLELLGKHLGAFLDPPAPPSRLNVRIKVVYEDRPRQVIDAGAQLVQLYTGLVYRGPALVRECVSAYPAR